jgi:phenylacetate-coenzyme A ligase PaaK-like adenylate-forming protein
VPDQTDRQHMHECEARHWLRLGHTNEAMVDELREKITAKRGAAAAERLIEEMRRQWKRRSEWLT